MTPSEALARAQTCARLASATTDPIQRIALEHMRELWIKLATEGEHSGDDISLQFEKLLDVQGKLLQLPAMARPQ
jgi:hypothetical protein